MKLVRIHDYGGPEQLRYEEVDRPAVEPGKLLIKIAAASVNPVDWKIRSGAARAILQFPMPIVPGGDIAGTVEEVGEGVSGWAVGDEVFALIGMTGGYAEYVLVDPASVARKPGNLSFVEAASLPLVALTAWQGFVADGGNLEGKTVLVHNAAGGVGSVAVQIAKAQGARVIGTASQANAEFVTALGADEVVDFRETPVASRARDIDILLDMVGNADALTLWSLVRPGGSVLRIAGGADAPQVAEENEVRVYKVRVRANGDQLAEIATLAEKGAIRPEVARTFPLAQAAEAQELSRSGHVRGKIVLEVG